MNSSYILHNDISMNPQSYFYNCSAEYIQSIDPDLPHQIITVIQQLQKRQTQSQINADLSWLLTSKDWNYDTVLQGTGNSSPAEFHIDKTLKEIKKRNNRKLCLASITLDTRWHSDFAKSFETTPVQVEAQFGKVESMFKGFC